MQKTKIYIINFMLIISALFFLASCNKTSLKDISSIKKATKASLNIIPTPKSIYVFDKKIYQQKTQGKGHHIIIAIAENKKSRIAAEKIAKKLKSLNIKSLTKHIKDLSDDSKANSTIIYLISPKQLSSLPNFPNKAKNLKKATELPQQGYIINFINDKNALVVGKDDQGILWGAITFIRLIKKDKKGIYFQKANIEDWPDYKYRGTRLLHDCFAYSLEIDETKKLIDQKILDNKLNLAQAQELHKLDAHAILWLKEVCLYARERGILVGFSMFVNLARSSDKNRPENQNMIEHQGMLYCWSREKLIDKKCKWLTEFAKEVKPGLIYLHKIDTQGKWKLRCDECKNRFGEDEAKGYANLYNKFIEAIKKGYPDCIVAVSDRYSMDFANKEDLKHFSRLISYLPSKTPFLVREHNRKTYEKRKEVFGSNPIMTYFSTWGYPEMENQIGMLYNTCYKYNKTFYFPESKEDIILNFSRNGSGDMVLGSSEFSWNANAPGARLLNSNGYDGGIAKVLFMEGETDESFKQFIYRAASQRYGEKAAPLIQKANILLKNASYNYILEYDKLIKHLNVWGADIPRKYHNSNVLKKMLDKINRAYALLLKAESTVKSEALLDLQNLMARLTVAKEVGQIRYLYVYAKELNSANHPEKALKELSKAKNLINPSIDNLNNWDHKLPKEKKEYVKRGIRRCHLSNGVKVCKKLDEKITRLKIIIRERLDEKNNSKPEEILHQTNDIRINVSDKKNQAVAGGEYVSVLSFILNLETQAPIKNLDVKIKIYKTSAME